MRGCDEGAFTVVVVVVFVVGGGSEEGRAGERRRVGGRGAEMDGFKGGRQEGKVQKIGKQTKNMRTTT